MNVLRSKEKGSQPGQTLQKGVDKDGKNKMWPSKIISKILNKKNSSLNSLAVKWHDSQYELSQGNEKAPPGSGLCPSILADGLKISSSL